MEQQFLAKRRKDSARWSKESSNYNPLHLQAVTASEKSTDVLLKALDNNLALASKIMDMVERKITQEGQISELPKTA